MNNLKKVVIVGRMNVGKSTLFNRLSTNVKSITLDYEGVTRDFIKDVVSWQGISFELIDTGGIDVKKSQDPLAESVRKIAINAVESANIILFMVDGITGIMPQELEIARYLRKVGKKVYLVINKSDAKIVQEQSAEFYRLGFDKQFFISAQHGLGIADLLESIVQELQTQEASEEEQPEPAYKVVFLGKPNVGKSSLMNLLLKQERSIVADMPGTTREAIRENVQFYQETIQLIDTAGVRKKKSVKENVEELMVKSTFHAVKDADIVMLLLDSSEGKLTDQELKLAFYVFEQGKALVLLYNKQDLIEHNDEKAQSWEYSKEEYEFFLKKLEFLNISVKTEKNTGKILPLVEKLWTRINQDINSVELTTLLKDALKRTPLYKTQQRLLLYRVQQVKKNPLTFVLYVNEPLWFEESQLSFFENVMRKHYNLKSVPVFLMVRKENKFTNLDQ